MYQKFVEASLLGPVVCELVSKTGYFHMRSKQQVEHFSVVVIEQGRHTAVSNVELERHTVVNNVELGRPRL